MCYVPTHTNTHTYILEKGMAPTPVFLPGESHRQRGRAGYMGLQRVRHDSSSSAFTHICTYTQCNTTQSQTNNENLSPEIIRMYLEGILLSEKRQTNTVQYSL